MIYKIPDDHIPEHYISVSEAFKRYLDLHDYELSLECSPALTGIYLDTNRSVERQSAAAVERWLASLENWFAEAFRRGELTAIYRLPGSEENKVLCPEDWEALAWPAKPFRGPIWDFPGDGWSKFDGRTLFVREAAFMLWLAGGDPAKRSELSAVKQKQQGEASTEKESDGSGDVHLKSRPQHRPPREARCRQGNP